MRLGLLGGRRRQHGPRQHALGQVVATLEAAPPGSRQPSGPEQELEHVFRLCPAPPGARPLPGTVDLRAAERSPRSDLVQHPRHELWPVPCRLGDAAPDALALLRARHAPAQQRLKLDGQKRGLVRPVLEEPASMPRLSQAVMGGEPVEQAPVVGTETREEGQVVGADQHAHRVELEQPEAADETQKSPLVGDGPRSRPGQPLRGQRHATRLGPRERVASAGPGRRIGEVRNSSAMMWQS